MLTHQSAKALATYQNSSRGLIFKNSCHGIPADPIKNVLSGDEEIIKPYNEYVLDKKPFFENDKFQLTRTSYSFLYESAGRMAIKYFPFGCGMGNYLEELSSFKKQGKYPDNIPAYEPHDIYISLMAITGLGGLIFLLFLPFAFYRTIRILWKQEPLRNISVASLVIFLVFGLESLTMGSLHMRHYWLFFAVVNAMYLQHRKEDGSIDKALTV